MSSTHQVNQLQPVPYISQSPYSGAVWLVQEHRRKTARRRLTFDTQSSPTANKVPSTPGQVQLAKELVKELKKYGAKNVQVDSHAIVTAEIPATSNKPAPMVVPPSRIASSQPWRGGSGRVLAVRPSVCWSLRLPVSRHKPPDPATAAAAALCLPQGVQKGRRTGKRATHPSRSLPLTPLSPLPAHAPRQLPRAAKLGLGGWPLLQRSWRR